MSDKPAITQAMIDAYDDFTHRNPDRRAFMERLTALCGSVAVAAAVAPMLAASSAKAAIVPENDARITGADVTYGEMKGYLARPATISAALPGVIVIHENRGLNAHTKDVARRIALEGFVALAPDFLSPKGGTPANEDEARTLIGQLDPAQNVANAEASLEWLESQGFARQATGAVGFCWGGGLVNRFATKSAKLKAGVAYYGSQAPLEDVPNIKAALLLHYGGQDERINAGIEAYRAALAAGGKTFEVHIYEGAQHAFNNDTSEARYNKAAADLAWGRTVAWFKRYLV
ncbi:dienelactone hydrolase family protein [Asticcacaulis sp. AC402]|uniref:dienelactone hydrolase family protein n=1 Tax=Asticcacaulis sp. AC402 TaxID=1282361 RepID=UPI0003C3B1F9|nr:dienelactone hydrolase family protein [Asticcacaulis sp. AC402]ESQ73701.1 carboxymethylenebutenolidase [Asticcacaulis sp. AC402]